VEAINEKEPAPGQASPTPAVSEPSKSTEAAPRAEAVPETKAASDDESRKKFSKKY
jgi:hypothetical protein